MLVVDDGIDECLTDEQQYFISNVGSLVGKLMSTASHTIKCLLTSRDYYRINKQFEKFPPGALIQLVTEHELGSVRVEIEAVIRMKVERLCKEKETEVDGKTRIMKKLLGRENVTYLWLDIAFKDLEAENEERLLPYFDELPNGIKEKYELILKKCNRPDEALRIFTIVLAAKRPFYLAEPNDAIAMATKQKAQTGYAEHGPASSRERKPSVSPSGTLRAHVGCLHEQSVSSVPNGDRLPLSKEGRDGVEISMEGVCCLRNCSSDT